MSELVNTFGGVGGYGQNPLPRNDDGSAPAFSLPQFETGLNFFGTRYDQVFVNNNGNITFGSSTGQFTPVGLGADYEGLPIIAPFFADVDTRGLLSGVTAYGSGQYNGHDAFVVTWPGVGYFSGQTNKLNSFQLILTDRSDVGAGNFDITFNYAQIQWESGSASGGVNGLGGVPAAAGYSAGTGADGSYYQLPGSLQSGQLLDNGANSLTHNSNVNVNGQYVFAVRNGQVIVDPGAPEEPPVAPPTTEVTFGLGGMALGREGDVGVTPYTFIITRAGGGLTAGSSVDWVVNIADVTDLAPGQALSGSVGFSPGQTQASVTILVQGDTIFEPDDMFEFRLTSATHGDQTFDPGVAGTAVILNDDLPNTFKFDQPLMIREGMFDTTAFDFDLVRAGDLTNAVTVTWKIDPRQTDIEDLAVGQPLTGMVTFGVGETHATIKIKVAGDTRVELDEVFGLDVIEAKIGPTVARLTGVSTTGTIIDDDERRTLLIASNQTLVKAEGDTGATDFTFNLTRIGDLTKAITLPYTITLPAGGVGAGEISGALTGEITFGIGASDARITVLVNGDLTPEDNESFLVKLGGANGVNELTLNGVVLNDDGGGIVIPPKTTTSAPSDVSDSSDFMQHLTGGSLWGNAGI